MKLSFILKFIGLMIISSGLHAQEFQLYKLFDNKYQAIFPGEPNRVHQRKELLDPKEVEKLIPHKYKKNLTKKQIKKVVLDIVNRNNIQIYSYLDKVNKIVYTSKYFPSGLKYNIGEYEKSIKKMLDDNHIISLKSNDNEIISFSSIFNIKKDIYTSISTSSYYTEGQKRYMSTKTIIYKKMSYAWSVMYPSLNYKYIFDNYKDHCKVIK